MTSLDFDFILSKLVNKRPIFHNEADFKFALSWMIKKCYQDVKIRLEVPIELDKRIFADILVVTREGWIPIELKYKTKELHCNFKNVLYDNYYLIEQSGEADARYDYLKDIKRIEDIRDEYSEEFVEGYAIFLTNELMYKEKTSDEYLYNAFAINDGAEQRGEISYNGKNNKYGEFILKGNDGKGYLMKWKDYSVIAETDFTFIDGSNKYDKFCYLISKIKKQS